MARGSRLTRITGMTRGARLTRITGTTRGARLARITGTTRGARLICISGIPAGSAVSLTCASSGISVMIFFLLPACQLIIWFPEPFIRIAGIRKFSAVRKIPLKI